jgi:hypothetical protein
MERADFGGRLLAIDEDLALAKYPVRDHLRVTVPAGEPGSGGWSSTPVRAVVEVQRNLGGMLWRALLGGVWVPADARRVEAGADRTTVIDLAVADDVSGSGAETWPSLLNGACWAGLTDEFAQPVAESMREAFEQLGFGPGTCHVDRAGFDMESSSSIFRSAGSMLAHVLFALSRGEDALVAAVRVMRGR